MGSAFTTKQYVNQPVVSTHDMHPYRGPITYHSSAIDQEKVYNKDGSYYFKSDMGLLRSDEMESHTTSKDVVNSQGNYSTSKDVVNFEENYSLLDNNLHETFLDYPKSTSCYLDGRYFYEAFRGYPGLCKNPLHVRIYQGEDGMTYSDVYMDYCEMDISVPVIAKASIQFGDDFLHSCLIIIEPEVNGRRQVLMFDPVEFDSKSASKEEIEQIVLFVGTIVESYLTTKIPNIDFDIEWQSSDKPISKCQVSGFCNAHIIMYANCYLKNYLYNEHIPYEPDYILSYVSMLEDNYTLCGMCEPQVEFGMPSSATTGLVLGGLGGLAIGGAAGAPLAGAAVGALGGYAVGSLAQ